MCIAIWLLPDITDKTTHACMHVAAQWLISYVASNVIDTMIMYTYRINHSASVILAVHG